MRINKFGLYSVISFLAMAFLARFFYPLGDEPDWSYRIKNLIQESQSPASIYYIFNDWFPDFLNVGYSCTIESDTFGFWAKISNDCNEPLSQILLRWIILLFISIPILFAVVFRRLFISLSFFLGSRHSAVEWVNRLNSVSLTLCFPGFLYYSGVVGVEQHFLFVALLIFIFWGQLLILALIITYLGFLDYGNMLVVLWFVLMFYLLRLIRNFNRLIFYIFLLFAVIASYVISFNFLPNLSTIIGFGHVAEKINLIHSVLFDDGIGDKYPLYYRVAITFMSFLFMTPSYIKIPVIYIAFIVFFIILALKVIKSVLPELELNFFAPLASILILIFLIPSHSNAKYFIFLVPFFISVGLNFFSFKNIFIFFFISNFIVFISLLLFRI